MFEEKFPNVILKSVGTLVYFINEIQTLYGVYTPWMRATIISIISKIPAKNGVTPKLPSEVAQCL